MKKRKWHFGYQSEYPDKEYSVCGQECDEVPIDKVKFPRWKDRCKSCDRIARRDHLFGMDGYFWFRRRED